MTEVIQGPSTSDRTMDPGAMADMVDNFNATEATRWLQNNLQNITNNPRFYRRDKMEATLMAIAFHMDHNLRVAFADAGLPAPTNTFSYTAELAGLLKIGYYPKVA